LREQVEGLNHQLAEKDSQISELMQLLKQNNIPIPPRLQSPNAESASSSNVQQLKRKLPEAPTEDEPAAKKLFCGF
jgi:hypothetical protein